MTGQNAAHLRSRVTLWAACETGPVERPVIIPVVVDFGWGMKRQRETGVQFRERERGGNKNTETCEE